MMKQLLPQASKPYSHAQSLTLQILLMLLILLAGMAHAQTFIIQKVAGNGSTVYPGNGVLATNAGMDPYGLAFDSSDDLYISDYQNNSVRKIDHLTGLITTVAGNGTAGFSGDGGPATGAQLNAPSGLAIDAAGDLFICDYNNNRIRKVDHITGLISTIAGTGTTSGYSGDGGPAVNAKLYHPMQVIFSSAGDLLIGDFGNDVIRKIDHATGIITTIIGNGNTGYAGDGGPAINAEFRGPGNITFDSAGNLYICDTYNYVVRKVDHVTGIITTIAGNGTSGFSGDGGAATSAQFYQPSGIAVDPAGDVFISDYNNDRIRKIDHLTGIISTAVGSTAGYSGDGGLATNAQIESPDKLLYHNGSLYLCDGYNNRVRKVSVGCSSYIIHNSASVSASLCVTDSAVGIFNSSRFNSGLYDNSCTVPVTCTVDWGDGITTNKLMSCSGNYSVTTKHKYTAPGTYTYKVKYQGAACTDSIVGSVTITPCGNLSGNVFNDLNNDCTQNAGEPGLSNVMMKASLGSNTYFAWTNATGNYSFGTLPAGTYLIQVNNMPGGYTVTCSGSLPHTTAVATGTVMENFALYCGLYDLAVTGIFQNSAFFPGQTDAVLPQVGIYNNACNFNIPGKVKLVLSPCLTYTTAIGHFHTPPSNIIPAPGGDTIVWNISNINNLGWWNNTYDFWTHVAVCTNAQVGDTACLTVMVLPTAGDANPNNNILRRCFVIGVSYDPNFKEADKKGSGVQGFIPQSTQELTYTLHFQNTGTAKAWNIYVLDTISNHLDLNSIEVIGASHPVQPFLLGNRTMKFMFANIMLPDSTHDEEHSHGYVTYRIRLNTALPYNTKIKNTGYIYFDYNDPVSTNTTLHTIQSPTGIEGLDEQLISVYPNPGTGIINISSAKSMSRIRLVNLLGEVIRTEEVRSNQATLDVSDLKPNIYFLQITDTEQGISTQKIVKE